MTFEELCNAHGAGGASNCKHPPGPFNTGDLAGMSKFITDLKAYMDSTNPEWDCTLLVRSPRRQDGTHALSHWEHIRDMTVDPNTGAATITTTDGLNQGGGRHDRIPADPGQNTWQFTPGQNGRLTGGTPLARRTARRGGWANNITTVSYVCCSKPAQ
jgi:hypothetical protein